MLPPTGPFVAEVERADVGRPAGGIDAIATVSNLGDPEAARMIRDELDAMDGYDDAVVSVSPLAPYTGALAPTGLVLANGRSAAAFVYGRDDLVPRLDFVDEAEQADQGDGVWLPVDVADELGVAPGDEVQLVLRYPSAPDVTSPLPCPSGSPAPTAPRTDDRSSTVVQRRSGSRAIR